MIGGLTALICVGIIVLILISFRHAAVVAETHRVTKAAEQVVVQAKVNRLRGVVPPVAGAVATQVVNARGQVVAATQQLAGKPPMASFQAKPHQLLAGRDLCPPAGLHGCMTVVSIRFLEPDGIWVAYAAGPTVPVVYPNVPVVVSLVGASVLLSMIAAVGTYRSVSTMLAPFEEIGAELAEITASGFDRRVAVPVTYEEIRRLAETVNSSLDRLEAALHGLQRHHFDVSHDLRTPIAAIRLELEEALMYPDDTHWPHTAAKLMEEIERLQAVVSDLANLNAAGHGRLPQPRPARPR